MFLDIFCDRDLIRCFCGVRLLDIIHSSEHLVRLMLDDILLFWSLLGCGGMTMFLGCLVAPSKSLIWSPHAIGGWKRHLSPIGNGGIVWKATPLSWHVGYWLVGYWGRELISPICSLSLLQRTHLQCNQGQNISIYSNHILQFLRRLLFTVTAGKNGLVALIQCVLDFQSPMTCYNFHQQKPLYVFEPKIM